MKELGGKRQITIGEAGPDRGSTAPPEPAAESWGTAGDSKKDTPGPHLCPFSTPQSSCVSET